MLILFTAYVSAAVAAAVAVATAGFCPSGFIAGKNSTWKVAKSLREEGTALKVLWIGTGGEKDIRSMRCISNKIIRE